MTEETVYPGYYRDVAIKKGIVVGKAHTEAVQMLGMVNVLIKTDGDYLTAVVSDRDLILMITHGVYIEIDQHGGGFHQVFVRLNSEGI